MKRKWTEEKALLFLKKNSSANVDTKNKVIRGELGGLTSCSAVDFLRNHCKYI